MPYHLWHMNAMPRLFESQAAVELGIWSREYGIEVKYEGELVNNTARVMLHFG